MSRSYWLTNPTRRKRTWKPRPSAVWQAISPYPTVDIVTIRKYTQFQYESFWAFSKYGGSPEFSNWNVFCFFYISYLKE